MLAALFGAAAWAEPALPLESESFSVDVTGNLAEVVFNQRFRNTSDHFVDATYLFPLDDDAAVDSMVLTVGDHVVRSEIHARDEARQLWTEAASDGKIAALTEQERPNVFTQAVSNLPPGEAIDVELHVVQPVDRVDGEWQLVLPLVVAPRFVRPGDEDEEVLARYVVPAEGLDLVADDGIREDGTGVRATIDAVIHAGLPIREVGSPSHPIAPSVVGADASVVLEDVPLTRDFVLTWRTAGDEPAAALLVGGKHALLMLEAPVATSFEERVPREVVWVLDTSGSMSGAPIELAKTALRRALTSMDPRDSFVLLGFGDHVRLMADRPSPATPQNVSHALSFLDRLTADGGTWMDRALQVALDLPRDPARRRTVVFVTDGEIGYESELLKEIATRSTEATFVALGIGASPNRYLLDEMARLGGGVSAYATLGSDGPAEMDALVAAMDRPVLTGVTVDWGARCPAHALAPVSIPDLRPGRPILVLAKVEQGCTGAVEVTARGGHGPVTFRVTPQQVPRDRALASTWARERVADLERQWMRGETRDVKGAIREIGLSYGIVTSETSFLAVDQRVVNPGGASEPVDQPLDLPDGVEYTSVAGAVEEVTVQAKRRAVDTSGTSLGVGISKEFLAQIPAGRTYQNAVATVPGVAAGSSRAAPNQTTWLLDGANVTNPVAGTFSINLNRDAVQNLDVALQGRLPEYAGVDGTTDLVTRSGTNDLEVRGELGGLVRAGSTASGHATGAAAGPVLRDKAWFFGSAEVRQVALEDVQSRATSVFGKLTAQPSTAHRFTLQGAGDPSTLELGATRASYGGGLVQGQWTWFPSPDLNARTSVVGASRTLGSVVRQSVGGATAVSALAVQDPLGGRHDLKLGAAASGWTVSSPARTLRVASVSTYAQDLAHPRSNLILAGGVRVDAVAGVVLASPRLFAAWDPFGDQRTKVSGGYGRYTDPARYLPPDLTDRSIPLTDELFVNAERELVEDLAVTATGTWARSRFAFAPSAALDPLPAAPVGSVEQRSTELAFGLRKVPSRRWSADGSFTLRPVLDPVARELLRDASAPWVPGFLDAYRKYALCADFGWDLPTDPNTTRIGGFARWASAIDGGAEWWLQDVWTLGASVSQSLDVRRGMLALTGSLEWVHDDPLAGWLPIEAVILAPSAPTVDQQPPLRVEASLSYGF